MNSCGANRCLYVLSHGGSFTFRAWAGSPAVSQCEISRTKAQEKSSSHFEFVFSLIGSAPAPAGTHGFPTPTDIFHAIPSAELTTMPVQPTATNLPLPNTTAFSRCRVPDVRAFHWVPSFG